MGPLETLDSHRPITVHFGQVRVNYTMVGAIYFLDGNKLKLISFYKMRIFKWLFPTTLEQLYFKMWWQFSLKMLILKLLLSVILFLVTFHLPSELKKIAWLVDISYFVCSSQLSMTYFFFFYHRLGHQCCWREQAVIWVLKAVLVSKSTTVNKRCIAVFKK